MSPEFPSGPHLGRLWLAFVAYAAGAATIIQMVVLPYVVPQLHAGHGLLMGQDSVTYHQLAAEQAGRIRALGWSEWTLRLKGQPTAGIASAIYAVSVPEPWTLIPLNAVLHATAAVVLVQIVQVFARHRRAALWATLPFVLYPSAMNWYSQLLKDGWFALGVLLFAFGWLELARLEGWVVGWRPVRSLGWVVLGTGLVWLVRPYAVLLMQGLALVLAVLATAVFLGRGLLGRLAWPKAAVALMLAWAMVGTVSVLAQPSEVSPQVAPEFPPRPVVTEVARWRSSPWLPWFIDGRLREVALVRDAFRLGYPEAGTNVDTDVEFRSARDVFAYLPRAAVIALFAPFPPWWVEEGASPGGTLMRRITALEMLGLYVALGLVPYAAWRWRRRVELYAAAVYCLGMMVIFSAAVTNVGVLYRLRYGFVMTLAALGIAALLADRYRRREAGGGRRQVDLLVDRAPAA